MNRLLQLTMGALLPWVFHTSLQAQASEPANPFKDLKAAAEALQTLKAESKVAAAPVTLPPPPPAPAAADAADGGRLAQVQVLAVVGSSALLTQGAGTSNNQNLSSFEVHDMQPALVGGAWVVPLVRDGQVRLYRHESMRIVKGVVSLAPDAIPVFDWRGGAPNLGSTSAGDEQPRVVGPEALSPSKRNIRL